MYADDFVHVINSMKNGLIDPATFITHRVQFDDVKDAFETWFYSSGDMIKAMVEME